MPEPSQAAMRAARQITEICWQGGAAGNFSPANIAAIIDRETGVEEMKVALKWALDVLGTLEAFQTHKRIVSHALNDAGLKKWEQARAVLEKYKGE